MLLSIDASRLPSPSISSELNPNFKFRLSKIYFSIFDQWLFDNSLTILPDSKAPFFWDLLCKSHFAETLFFLFAQAVLFVLLFLPMCKLSYILPACYLMFHWKWKKTGVDGTCNIDLLLWNDQKNVIFPWLITNFPSPLSYLLLKNSAFDFNFDWLID